MHYTVGNAPNDPTLDKGNDNSVEPEYKKTEAPTLTAYLLNFWW